MNKRLSLLAIAAVISAGIATPGHATDYVSTTSTVNSADAPDSAITVNVYDTDSTDLNAVVFSGQFGATTQLTALNVGTSTYGGEAIFTNAAAPNVAAVTITGTGTNGSYIKFQDGLTSTSVTLDDGTGSATAYFTAEQGAGSVSGTIDGASSGEGALVVYDEDGGAPDTVAFSGKVGNTNKLKSVTVGGTSTDGGSATFADTVAATTITVAGGAEASEAATSVFSGAVTTTTLNVTGGSNGTSDTATAQFISDLTATSIVLDDGTTAKSAILSLAATAADQTVAGAITAAADGEGEVQIINAANTATFSGNIGTSSIKLNTVEIATGAVNYGNAVFNGNVYADTIRLGLDGNDNTANTTADFNGDISGTTMTINSGTGTESTSVTMSGNLTMGTSITFNDGGTGNSLLTLDGTSAQTISGAIMAGADGEGDITVSNTGGTVTFSSAIGDSTGSSVDDITLAASTTTVFSGKVDADKITSSGSVQFDVDGNTIDEDFNLADGSTIVVGTGVAGGETAVTVTAQATDLTGNTITVQMPSNLSDADSVIVIANTSANLTNATYTVTDTALFDYTLTNNAAGNIVVVAAKNSTAAIATSLGLDSSAGAAVSAASTGITSTAGVAALSAALAKVAAGTMSSTELVAKISPDTSSASAGSIAGVGAVGGVVGGHQTSAALGSDMYGTKKYMVAGLESGVNSGDVAKTKGFWMQASGSTSDMGTRNNDAGTAVEGYDADVVGLTMGVDGRMGDNVIVGLALSYMNIDVDGKSAAKSHTETDQVQATLYGTMLMDKYYVTGNIGYAFGDSDVSKLSLLGTELGSYDTDTFVASIGGGMPMDMGKFSLTPQANISYSHIDAESYTESLSGMTVTPDKMNIVHITAGAALNTKIKQSGGTLVPEVRVMADWDVTQEAGSGSANYAGGTAFQTSEGAEPGALGANLGLGLDYATDDGQYVLSIDYDASLRSDYGSHSGSVKVRYNFQEILI